MNRTYRDFDWGVIDQVDDALRTGNIEGLQHLIDTRFGVHNERHTKSLYFAIPTSNLEIVKMLLDAGVDRDYHTAEDEDGPKVSPLHYAVDTIRDPGLRWAMVKLLVENGVSPQLENLYRDSALCRAVELGLCDIVRFFSDGGANVNYSYKYGKGYSPLHLAITGLKGQARLEMVKLLIELGADVNAADTESQQTCLHLLPEEKSDSCEVFQLLLEAGVKLDCFDKDGSPPLAIAASEGDCELIKLMIAAGANVNLSKTCESSPLYMAVTGYERDAVQILLEKGANPNIMSANSSILSVAADFENGRGLETEYIEILKLLLTNGAKPHATDNENNIPFRQVLASGTMEAIHVFFEHGVTLENCEVSHPLHRAAENPTCDILEYLLKSHRYDVDGIEHTDSQSFTALFAAVDLKRTQNVRLLVEWGADVNVPFIDYSDNEAKSITSPLIQALENGDSVTAELLLCAGANANIDPSDEIWEYITDRVSSDSQFRAILISLIAEAYLIESRSYSKLQDHGNVLMEKFASLSPELEQQRLLAELETLQGLIFYGSCTYYDLLRGKDVTRYMNSSRVTQSFESQNVEERFPIYGNRLKICYSLAKIRCEMADKVMKILREAFSYHFYNHHEILFTIISHLKLKDLRFLCKF